MKKFIFLLCLVFLSFGTISRASQYDDYFCQIENGKISPQIIYESDKVRGIIDPNNPKEILFYTRFHFKDLYNIHLISARTLLELIIVIDETVEKKLGWADGFCIESKQGKFSEFYHLYIRVYRSE